jgi:serine/threonine protein phosphatase 1
MGRTFVLGDLHGDLDALTLLLKDLPQPLAEDTLVFLGDYLDRGPRSKETIEFLRELPGRTAAKVVTLRGNHEDAWLKVVDQGWAEYLLPPGNGCLATLRSFQGGPALERPRFADAEDFTAMERGSFFPAEVVAWMRALPYWYEDEHALYVHAGLPRQGGGFPHPSKVEPQSALLWVRTKDFFTNYRGKYVVFGHTCCDSLPQDLSAYTPEDPADVFAGPCVAGIDTGAGKPKGFLSALELPARRVYESRRRATRK